MKVKVKFFAVDLPVGLREKEFELPEGARLEDALDACLLLAEIKIEPDYFKASCVLCNGCRQDLDAPLNDGDVLTVLRTMEGG